MEITITIKADKEELPALKGQNEPKETTSTVSESLSQTLSSQLLKTLQSLESAYAVPSSK